MTFDSMFQAIHGYAPFPWQSEAARLLVEGRFFNAVNVPTASGKTAIIDAAVYAAAHGGPRTIAFIINRRVVVDEAYERAKRIAEGLASPLLFQLSTRMGPIQVVRLRGGVHGDDNWVLYPDRLTIIISTVDQIGSRLLHRGYGVSTRMAPLHAGFVGNNALYIVDEAHISVPFLETVESARRQGANIRVIAMTATPIADTKKSIQLSKEDRINPVLQQRINAKKRIRLIDISETEPLVKEADFVKKAVSEAQRLSESAKVVGIVVNRVDSARKIQQALVKAKCRAELLTGRIRPYDRDRLMERVMPEIRAGRKRGSGDTLFIVATQTVEVGADIDFDALVAEAASLDALRQRFGRLDRLGELGVTEGAILYRPKFDNNGEPLPDPIYENEMHDAWKWLWNMAQDGIVDFGISAMETSLKKEKSPEVNHAHAPVLLPSHIKLLVQTGPEAPYVDISAWLHGVQDASADVSLIWRADLHPDEIDHWADIVCLCPPLNRESLQVPSYAAIAWLSGGRMQPVTDLEGIKSPVLAEGKTGMKMLRWRGPDDCEVSGPENIRPGDTLLIPAKYGGCDAYGWFPVHRQPVTDIGDFCSLDRKNRHVVRLVPELTKWLGSSEKDIQQSISELIEAETTVDPENGVDQERVNEAHSHLRKLLKAVKHPMLNIFGGRFEIERHPSNGIVLRGGILDDVHATLSGNKAVTLKQHETGVALLAKRIAQNHPEQDCIVQAAFYHDHGKAESRFQTMLHGDPFEAARGPTLAKSGFRRLSQKLAAYGASGLPRGFRHELASLANSGTTARPKENTLVRHLIATHHGYGRPWFPACNDPEAQGANLTLPGSGWLRAFSELIDRYGPWFLAGMELLLRASDIRQSMAEQEDTDA